MSATLSEGCLRQLYLQKYQFKRDPILQILNFEISDINPKQIIIRVSDKQSFIDCLLVGPYTLVNQTIIADEFNSSSRVFKKMDIVKISDYFCKIDTTKICHLKIIIRKITELSTCSAMIGIPQEISEFIQSNFRKQVVSRHHNQSEPLASLKNNTMGREQTPIKIEQESDNCIVATDQTKNINKPQQIINKNMNDSNIVRKQQDPLTLYDILNNKPGYFVGRLIRIKLGIKDTKDGQMSFLYLGFVDLNGQLVRIHLAGRLALKESKELKKNRCYYIKGLELFYADKLRPVPQIRLKEREYKLHEVANQILTSRLKHEYYHWEHEYETIQFENVDVIGIIEDIQEKISYKQNNNQQEQREVVRIIIRNIYKTVKISFWSYHIKIIQQLNIKKKQPIIFQDIKKKKSIFLDFMPESTIILLDEDEQVKQQFLHLLPSNVQINPKNIIELHETTQVDPNNSTVRTLTLYLSRINENRIIYKMCVDCKKRVERILEHCLDCQNSHFIFKYNCQIDFSDFTGSVSCVVFDQICEKIFRQTAFELSLLNQCDIKMLCDQLVFEQYRVGIEYKNNRFFLRNLQLVKPQELMTNLLQNLAATRDILSCSSFLYF